MISSEKLNVVFAAQLTSQTLERAQLTTNLLLNILSTVNESSNSYELRHQSFLFNHKNQFLYDLKLR